MGLPIFGRLTSSLLLLLQCNPRSASFNEPLSGLARRAFAQSEVLRRFTPSDPQGQLDRQLGGRRLAAVRKRVVNATWECTKPSGDCFANHAAQEGLPTGLKGCVNETNAADLTVIMEIDLHCLKYDNKIHCDKDLNKNPFDPFYLCNNDPALITAVCQMRCKMGYPFEICTFNFDPQGKYNMSSSREDMAIDICGLEAACMSPYIEHNEIYCSGHKEVHSWKPAWLQRPMPPRGRAWHEIKAPLQSSQQEKKSEAGAVSGLVHWVLLLGASMLLCVAVVHKTSGGLQSVVDSVSSLFSAGSQARAMQIGTPYRAPPVADASSQQMPQYPSQGGGARTAEGGPKE